MKMGLFVAVLFIVATGNAQDNIAYADVEYIFNKLPVAKQIEAELKSLQTQLESQLKAKYEEFRKKYDLSSDK